MEQNEYINKLLLDYLNGESTMEQLHQLKAWIESAPENRSLFNETISIWHGIHPSFNPEEIDIAKAEKRLPIKNRKSIPVRMLYYWRRIAAVVAIPLLLYSLYTIKNNDNAVFTAVEYQEITVPYGTYSEMNLPDGSKVWLNSGSSLKYPVRFTNANREVQLHGEGFFEVKSDKTSPFIVKTGNMTLKATGTAFNIESYDSDSLTAVTMLNGVVDVAFINKTPVRMNAGARITYNNLTGKSQMQQFDFSNNELYKWYSWKDGIMILRDDPLSMVFKRLSQIYNVEFIVKDPEISKAKYRATFHKESLGEIIRLLEMTAPIQFKYKERTQLDNVFEKQQIEVLRLL